MQKKSEFLLITSDKENCWTIRQIISVWSILMSLLQMRKLMGREGRWPAPGTQQEWWKPRVPCPAQGSQSPPHLDSLRALWDAPAGRPIPNAPHCQGSTKLRLSVAWDRRNEARWGAEGVRPHGGAGAQPPQPQGRGCGARPATRRQSFLSCAPNRHFATNRQAPPRAFLIAGSGNSILPVS